MEIVIPVLIRLMLTLKRCVSFEATYQMKEDAF